MEWWKYHVSLLTYEFLDNRLELLEEYMQIYPSGRFANPVVR